MDGSKVELEVGRLTDDDTRRVKFEFRGSFPDLVQLDAPLHVGCVKLGSISCCEFPKLRYRGSVVIFRENASIDPLIFSDRRPAVGSAVCGEGIGHRPHRQATTKKVGIDFLLVQRS